MASATGAPPMLVLCDFDGTITTDDVTNVLWDRYGLANWRERLLPAYRAGQTSTLELMDTGWRAIAMSADDLLLAARAKIALRDGFTAFLDGCANRRWDFHVISCGLDWYLRAFLPSGVPFTSYAAVLEDGWRVRLPEGHTLPPGADFKVHVMRQLQVGHPGVGTVFIGDGRNDFPIAQACDHVFALGGSTLARLCGEAGVACVEFESFNEIGAALASAGPVVHRRPSL
jgi:2-hydroxy-3-keto-5-methylthiopentenyl-1-phosphate phosphatase